MEKQPDIKIDIRHDTYLSLENLKESKGFDSINDLLYYLVENENDYDCDEDLFLDLEDIEDDIEKCEFQYNIYLRK